MQLVVTDRFDKVVIEPGCLGALTLFFLTALSTSISTIPPTKAMPHKISGGLGIKAATGNMSNHPRFEICEINRRKIKTPFSHTLTRKLGGD
jgi:hypothetical protein